MTFSELKRILKKNGCYMLRDGGGHEIWYSPKTGKKFSIGRHKTQEVASGTLKSIKQLSGIE